MRKIVNIRADNMFEAVMGFLEKAKEQNPKVTTADLINGVAHATAFLMNEVEIERISIPELGIVSFNEEQGNPNGTEQSE